MMNEIIKGIARALNTEFGSKYDIYQNDVRQGLHEPCFFIAVLKPDVSPLLSGRYIRDNPFDIHYFPKRMDSHTEMYSVAERLIQCLEFITLPNGDIFRGTKMNYEVIDDVLHFFVNFNCIVIRDKEPEELMKDLKTDASVKPMGGIEWQ